MTIPRVAQPPKDIIPDYEVELTIVIGKAAKNVSEERALDYVLGYTGANDVSQDLRSLTILTICPLLRCLSVNTNSPYRSGVSQRVSVRFSFVFSNLFHLFSSTVIQIIQTLSDHASSPIKSSPTLKTSF